MRQQKRKEQEAYEAVKNKRKFGDDSDLSEEGD